MPLPLIGLACALALQDTVVVLGTKERDLTGDGKPETLRLVGVGRSLDSLNVTLYIESDGKRIYEQPFMPLTRKINFDGRPSYRTRAEHRAFLEEYGGRVFGDGKFESPAEFVRGLAYGMRDHIPQIPALISAHRRAPAIEDSLRRAGQTDRGVSSRAWMLAYNSFTAADSAVAAQIWEDIQTAGVIVFQFSPGYDRVDAIAWSARDQRFYDLIACC